jgi:autotransporter-associated beta strand protein
MKSRSNPFLRTAALAAFSLTLSAIPADAATVTWSGVTGADWDAGANWSGSAKPATADTALFNLTGTTSVANAVADQTVTGITFDTAIASSGAFTLGTTGGKKLTLQDTGTIQILSSLTGTGKTITVNAPLVLAGTSYSFVNDNTTTSNTLKFGGAITSTSGIAILTLGGANKGTNTISGSISNGASGTMGVAKTGDGAWTFSGADSNTYTGTTTLSGKGKILLAKTGGATAIAGDIILAGTGNSGNSSGIVLGGNEQIADTSILSSTGATADTFFRLNGYTETLGGLSDSAGKAVIENRGNGDGVTYGTGTLKINTTGSSSYTFGGTIRDMDGGSGGGAVAIVKSGTGTQTLTGNKNVYTGTTAVNGGVLSVGILAANGTTSDIGKGTTLSFDGGTLRYTGGANTTFNRDITLNAGGGTIETANSLSCPGVISGTAGGAFIKTGAGALTLGGSGNNTYTGTTTLGGNGKILLAKTGGATAIAGDINLASTAWNGNNSGIVLGGNEQIADTSVITWTGGSGVYGGTLRLNGFTETIGGLVATNGGDNVVENRGSGDGGAYGTGTLTINTTGSSSYTFGGTIRDMDGGTGGGAVAIVKSGTGTQTFSGTNTYTGVTAVSNGTLVVSGNISTSTLTTVAVGATLGGTGTVGKAIVNGTLAVGNSPGQMNFTDTLGLNGTTVMEIDGTAGAGVAGGHDFANLTGAGAAGVLTYGGAMTLDIGTIFGVGTYSWNLFDMASETGTFNPGGITLADQYSGSLLDGDLNGVWDLTSGSNTWQFTESTGVLGLTVVPEPSVAALLGGIGTLMLLRRRRA